MKSIVLHHHLGLGDHFVCNGMVNYLCNVFDLIYLPCKERNFTTVEHLYADNPQVIVFGISGKEHDRVDDFSRIYKLPVLKVGFKHCNKKEFNTSFYQQLNIDFSVRHEMFRLPAEIPLEEDIFQRFAKKEYCLVHREASISKYDIRLETTLPVVDIEKDTDPYGDMLNYRKLVQNASEIHCVNSSVFHFVDSLETPAKLYYHDIRKRDFKLSDKWTTIEYD